MCQNSVIRSVNGDGVDDHLRQPPAAQLESHSNLLLQLSAPRFVAHRAQLARRRRWAPRSSGGGVTPSCAGRQAGGRRPARASAAKTPRLRHRPAQSRRASTAIVRAWAPSCASAAARRASATQRRLRRNGASTPHHLFGPYRYRVGTDRAAPVRSARASLPFSGDNWRAWRLCRSRRDPVPLSLQKPLAHRLALVGRHLSAQRSAAAPASFDAASTRAVRRHFGHDSRRCSGEKRSQCPDAPRASAHYATADAARASSAPTAGAAVRRQPQPVHAGSIGRQRRPAPPPQRTAWPNASEWLHQGSMSDAPIHGPHDISSDADRALNARKPMRLGG